MDFHTFRNTAILGLIQVGVIVAGVLAAGVYLRWAVTFSSPARLTVATALADQGCWALFIPVVWVSAALAAMRGESDRAQRLALGSGLLLIALLVVGVVVAVVLPWLRLFEW